MTNEADGIVLDKSLQTRARRPTEIWVVNRRLVLPTKKCLSKKRRKTWGEPFIEPQLYAYKLWDQQTYNLYTHARLEKLPRCLKTEEISLVRHLCVDPRGRTWAGKLSAAIPPTPIIEPRIRSRHEENMRVYLVRVLTSCMRKNGA